MALSLAFRFGELNANQSPENPPKQWWKQSVWKQAESLQNLWSNPGTELEGFWDKISQAKLNSWHLEY